MIIIILIPVFLGLIAGLSALILGDVRIPVEVWTMSKWAGGAVFLFWALDALIKLIGGVTNDLNQVLQITNPQHKVPEIDHNGTVIAYRYFAVDGGVLTSVTPIGRVKASDGYKDGFLTSDRVPTLKNTNGIYAAKTWNSPILRGYKEPDRVLAKVELSGRVIEAEYGYRAQHCRVLEILDDE